MSLSAREQRILREIEHELASSWPPLDHMPAGARLASRERPAVTAPARWRRGADGIFGWVAAMVGGLLVGIALLAAGLVLDVPGMMIGGAVLTQLSPVTVSLLSGLSRRIRRRGAPSRSVDRAGE
jgi:hypothetical protein